MKTDIFIAEPFMDQTAHDMFPRMILHTVKPEFPVQMSFDPFSLRRGRVTAEDHIPIALMRIKYPDHGSSVFPGTGNEIPIVFSCVSGSVRAQQETAVAALSAALGIESRAVRDDFVVVSSPAAA